MEDFDKYKDVLNDYILETSEEKISIAIDDILEKNMAKFQNKETYKLLYSCIDLTTLNSTDSEESVSKFVENVNDFDEKFSDLENVAAICVYPNFAKTVKDVLTAGDVKIACVSGGFPSSQTFLEVKVAETALAVASGADEIDIVINLGYLLDGDYQSLCTEIEEIKTACREAKLKVIVETGAMQSLEDIRVASVLSLYSGADFLKTSTGKVYKGASLEAAYIMCQCIKRFYEKTNRMVGFKVSGGVATSEEAVKYFTVVNSILGDEWNNKNMFRIGASRLANNLLQSIGI